MKYQITMAASFLYEIGVTFHGTGTISDKIGRKLYDLYKCDTLTQKQKEKLLLWNPNIKFFTVSPQFAPEISKVGIGFPKKAMMREIRNMGI